MKSDYKYHNEAVKAFQSLDEALRPFVKQEMSAVYKERWLEYIAKQVRWERDEPIWDTLALLHTMRWQWDDVFKMKRLRGPEELGKVSALIGWRNRIQGHSPEPVDKEDAEAAINSILHLLKHINAATQVYEVEQLLEVFQPKPLPVEETQTKDEHSTQSDRITKQLEEGQKKLEVMGSDIDVTPPPPPPPLPVGDLRVERVQSANGVWWLLQIYDGDTLIGSYERSKTESEAKEKEIEILWPNNPDKRNIAAYELRKAYAKNGEKPFVVRWIGSAVGQDGKKGVKQIKDEKIGELLGEFPKCCFRK